jgi:hypothetical protein
MKLPTPQGAICVEKLIRHRAPGFYGCGRPEAPSLIIPRSATREFAFLKSIVERCPQASAKIDPSDSFKTLVALDGQPTRVIDAISDYGVLTPGPVRFSKARVASDDHSVIVGVAAGNIAGVTVAIVDYPEQQPPEDPFILHVSTDSYDAGLQLQDECATLVTLRPQAAEVWFLGRTPAWVEPMRAQELRYDKLRKLTWNINKKDRAILALVAASLFAAIFLRVKITPRF